MGKKRLVIDLTDVEHAGLVRTAREFNLTLSNYVRKTLKIPLRQQGIKHSQPAVNSKRPRGSKSAQ